MSNISPKSVVILGPRTLQNCVLGTFIGEATVFPCQILSSVSDIPAIRLDNEILFLVDVSAPGTYPDLLNLLWTTARVVLINSESDDDDWYEILHRFDLRGVFLKNSAPEQFVQGINSIFAGEFWFTRELTAEIFHRMRKDIHRAPDTEVRKTFVNDILTSKEKMILAAMLEGCTNQDIADKIFLSPYTVKTHIYHLYKKIGAANRVQAVNWARVYLNNELVG